MNCYKCLNLISFTYKTLYINLKLKEKYVRLISELRILYLKDLSGQFSFEDELMNEWM